MNVFIKKIMDWVLEGEEKAAQECDVSPDEVNEQIRKTLLKKKELSERCKDQKKELEYILNKLHWIKAEALKCEKNLDTKE